jgi:hypothetical protein
MFKFQYAKPFEKVVDYGINSFNIPAKLAGNVFGQKSIFNNSFFGSILEVQNLSEKRVAAEAVDYTDVVSGKISAVADVVKSSKHFDKIDSDDRSSTGLLPEFGKTKALNGFFSNSDYIKSGKSVLASIFDNIFTTSPRDAVQNP